MTDTIDQTPTDKPKADETFTWTDEPEAGKGPGASTAANILDSVREVVDELAERAAPTMRELADRAAPTVRELSARAAELTAIAADRAAPLAKRAGEATAEASGRLAAISRAWASDLRATMVTPTREPSPEPDAPVATAETGPGEPVEGGSSVTEESRPI